MFDLNEFAKEVHQNAIDHGFWEDATDERQIALIHSEWSEALQADRSGCTPREVCMELIDGVLRVLDYCAAKGFQVSIETQGLIPNFFILLNVLHGGTNMLRHVRCGLLQNPCCHIPSIVFDFVRSYGFDPYELMKQKHEFNLTRPHKHAKRY